MDNLVTKAVDRRIIVNRVALTPAVGGRGDQRQGSANNRQDSTESDLSPAEAEALVAELNSKFEQLNHSLRFKIDEVSARMIIKVVDAETGELVRQIQADRALAVARIVGEFLRNGGTAKASDAKLNELGLLFDEG